MIQRETLHDYLFRLKEELQSPGNAVNFIAQVAEGEATGRTREALEETLASILALAVEQPLAESVRIDQRWYHWKPDEGGEAQLFLGFKSFAQILAEAIASSQKADLELPRYQANLDAYQRLRQGRLAGDNGPFVEFSPSPLLTAEARGRGYRGNSYIGIFDLDKDQTERFTQYWFRASWEEIAQMMREKLRMSLPQAVSDVDIMSASDFVDVNQLEEIGAFIKEKRGTVAQNKENILHYTWGELYEYLKAQLSKPLQVAARELLQGESIEKELELIITTIQWAQNKFNQWLATVIQLPVKYISVLPEEETYYDAHPWARSSFVQEKKMPLVGCGSSITFAESDPFGINDSRGEDVDEYGSLNFACPSCKQIVRRPRGVLLENCPRCKADVKC